MVLVSKNILPYGIFAHCRELSLYFYAFNLFNFYLFFLMAVVSCHCGKIHVVLGNLIGMTGLAICKACFAYTTVLLPTTLVHNAYLHPTPFW